MNRLTIFIYHQLTSNARRKNGRYCQEAAFGQREIEIA